MNSKSRVSSQTTPPFRIKSMQCQKGSQHLKLERIESTKELYLFASELSLLHGDVEGVWDNSTDFHGLFTHLMTSFEDSICYGKSTGGKLEYFLYVMVKGRQAVLYLMYIPKECRVNTKSMLKSIKEDLVNVNCQSLGFISNNLTSSFKRWAKSLEAEPVSINYKIKL